MDKLRTILLLLCAHCMLVQAWDLTILHTNDIHAHVEQMNVRGGECSPEEVSKKECYGGYARQATVLKEIRSREENVLLLSGGDWSQGTVWYYRFQGAASALMMQQLGYDAGAIGNHEFDKGIDVFVDKFADNVTFSILSANCDASKEPRMQGKFDRSVTLDLNGKSVGIIGYTTSQMSDLSITLGNLVFTDEVEAVKREAEKLKAAGVEVIIAVGHSGFPTDKRIAREVPHVDVVVGGHDNTFMFTGDAPSVEVPKTTYPHVEKNLETGREVPVLVVQDYMFGKYLGNLTVTFDDSGEPTDWEGNPILLDAKRYDEDPAVLATLAPMKEELRQMRYDVIGFSLVDYIAISGSTKFCRTRECNLGNLFTDAMVEMSATYQEGVKGWARAAAAFTNSGGIRGNLVETPRTNITNGRLLEAIPFSDTIEMIVLTGSTLYKVFEHSASLWHQKKGRFLQVSGFRVIYDMTQPVGSRVVSLEIRCSECSSPALEPVVRDSSRTYNVLTRNYVANGGDGFKVILEERKDYVPLGWLDADLVREYVRKYSPLYGGTEGRIFTTNPVPCSPGATGGAAGYTSGFLWAVVMMVLNLLLR